MYLEGFKLKDEGFKLKRDIFRQYFLAIFANLFRKYLWDWKFILKFGKIIYIHHEIS